jgi:hypothetical protein
MKIICRVLGRNGVFQNRSLKSMICRVTPFAPSDWNKPWRRHPEKNWWFESPSGFKVSLLYCNMLFYCTHQKESFTCTNSLNFAAWPIEIRKFLAQSDRQQKSYKFFCLCIRCLKCFILRCFCETAGFSWVYEMNLRWTNLSQWMYFECEEWLLYLTNPNQT